MFNRIIHHHVIDMLITALQTLQCGGSSGRFGVKRRSVLLTPSHSRLDTKMMMRYGDEGGKTIDTSSTDGEGKKITSKWNPDLISFLIFCSSPSQVVLLFSLFSCLVSLHDVMWSTGRGSLFLLNHSADPANECLPGIGIRSAFPYDADSLFDVTWSEAESSILWAASGDGMIHVYDLSSDKRMASVRGHEREVSAIEWSPGDRSRVASCSWDSSVMIWDAQTATPTHRLGTSSNAYCHAVAWSVRMPGTLAAASADGILSIYHANNTQASMQVRASNAELLSCDFSKYDDHLIVVSSVDSLIRGFDLRSPSNPVFVLPGHERAVKRVKFNPFERSILCSTSFDFTTRIWDLGRLNHHQASHDYGQQNPFSQSSGLVLTMQNHTEFVYGLDFSLHRNGLFADCGWDQRIVICQPVSWLMIPHVNTSFVALMSNTGPSVCFAEWLNIPLCQWGGF